MEIDPPRILRASKLRFGDLRAQGVPAILLGAAAIVLAAGFVRVLRAAAPALPETLREAKALIEATRPALRLVIDDASMTALIRESFPDAQVRIHDLTGTMDHFEVLVRTSAFAGKSLMDRHRLVEKALKQARDDGRIHALAIRTDLPE